MSEPGPDPEDLPELDDLVEWDSTGETFAHLFDPDEDLKEQLATYVEERSETFDTVAFYRDYGEFRDTSPLTPGEQERVGRVAHHQEPQECYYNAQMAVTSGDVAYVEGYVTLPKSPGPIPHAWIEINGKVAEITLPDGDREEAVYYGVQYVPQTVRDALLVREEASPLAENPDEYPPREASENNE